jgi:hypothetical protein
MSIKFLNLFIIVLVLSFLSLFSSNPEKPEKVYRLCYTQKSQEWYKNQAELWKKEVKNNPQNERGWYYYFFAIRYKTLGIDSQRRERIQDQLIKEMGKAISDSYIYYYIRFYHGIGDFKDLQKAYQINPNDPDLYWEFMRHYDDEGDWQNRKIFCSKLYESKDIASGLLEYNYNVLASTEQNAILLTNGDNDTYPAWVLQDAKDIRNDVLVLNAHHIFVDREYLDVRLKENNINIESDSLSNENTNLFVKDFVSEVLNKYPDAPIYVALTVYNSYISSIKNKLYLVGLAYKYSKSPIDSTSILIKNVENNLRLDYLDFDWYDDLHISYDDLNRINTNYVNLFLQIGKNYFDNSDFETAKQWKNKALKIAIKAEKDSIINQIKSLSW